MDVGEMAHLFRPGPSGLGNSESGERLPRKVTVESWRRLYQGQAIRKLAATSALALVLLLALATLLVNFGYLLLQRWQLEQAAEAGATAGARALDYSTSPNFSLAVSRATAKVRECSVGGQQLSDFNADGSLQKVQAGYWDLRWTKDTAPANLNGYTDPAHYSPSVHEVPAVKVNLTRTSSGCRPPLSACLASFVGFGQVDMATFAVAVRLMGRNAYGANVNAITLVD